jgi:hypothetical protein
MQMQSASNPSSQFPMHELEQIDTLLKALSQWETTLEERRTFLFAELDRITQPPPAPLRLVTKMIRRGFEYRGILYEHQYCIGIHIGLLRCLWTDFPNRREAMAQEMGRDSRIRPYVTKTLADLFPGQTQVFSRRNGRPLVDDWYVDKNLNPRQMRAILLAAVTAAGLKLGNEVKIYWRQTQVSVSGL